MKIMKFVDEIIASKNQVGLEMIDLFLKTINYEPILKPINDYPQLPIFRFDKSE